MVKTKEFVKPKKKDKQKKKTNKNIRKIPKEKFQAALELIKKPNAKIWHDGNTSCSINIHNVHNVNQIDGYSSVYTFIRHARIFLLRRDTASLANIVRLVNLKLGRSRHVGTFPLFVKYASLCLANGNHELLKMFCKTLFQKDIEHMMEMCTTYDNPAPREQ